MFAHIIPNAAYADTTYYYSISSDTNGVDLWADIVAENGGIPSQSNIQVTIQSGVTVGAVSNASATNYAIDVSTDFDSNSKTLTIINNGYISGVGGNGGAYDALTPGDGGNGGIALFFESDATLINNGTIAGGGGGGGGNTEYYSEPGSSIRFYSDGGGGAGVPAGTAGGGYPSDPNYYGASDGTKTTGGNAALGLLGDEKGGDGGNRGQDGEDTFGGTSSGGSAGAPYSASGVTVAFTNNGEVYGTAIT